MRKQYQVAFIIPAGANKTLGEDGWEFVSLTRLPEDIIGYLIRSLKLSFSESYLGIDSYINEGIKMSIVFDERNGIESIHFQLNEDSLDVLTEVCQSSQIFSEFELFVPR